MSFAEPVLACSSWPGHGLDCEPQRFKLPSSCTKRLPQAELLAEACLQCSAVQCTLCASGWQHRRARQAGGTGHSAGATPCRSLCSPSPSRTHPAAHTLSTMGHTCLLVCMGSMHVLSLFAHARAAHAHARPRQIPHRTRCVAWLDAPCMRTGGQTIIVVRPHTDRRARERAQWNCRRDSRCSAARWHRK